MSYYGATGALEPLGITDHQRTVQELEALRTDLFRGWPRDRENYPLFMVNQVVELMTRLAKGYAEMATEAIAAKRNLFVWEQIVPLRSAVKRTYEKPSKTGAPWLIRLKKAEKERLSPSTVIFVGTGFHAWVKAVLRDLIAGWGGLGYIEGLHSKYILYMTAVLNSLHDAVEKIVDWFSGEAGLFEIKQPPKVRSKGDMMLYAAAGLGLAFLWWKRRR